jgi:hypothetical protein
MKTIRRGSTCLLACLVFLTIFFYETHAVLNFNTNNNPLRPTHKTVSDRIRGGAREQKDENADTTKTKALRPPNKQQEREQLYEAYNLLHSLAQVIYRANFPSTAHQ